MQEALALARAELGEDAVVLNSKHVKANGMLGLRGGSRIELTAAVDDESPQPVKPDLVSASAHVQRKPAAPAAAASPAMTSFAAKLYADTSIAPAEYDAELKQLRSELSNLGSIVRNLMSTSQVAVPISQPLIIRCGIDEDIARGPLSDLLHTEDPISLASALAGKMQAFAVPPMLDGQQIIAVVGPTGVGKTTTLAKLAARFALEQGKKVALVTADTFRIGAVEQLRTYARIMGVPLEIALSPEEVGAGVAKHMDKDIILIDTVGRSQRSDEHLAELKTFIDAAKPTDTYLVVAASLGGAVQREVVQKFTALSPTRLVITKLDESDDFSCLINLPLRTGLGITCMTAGQNVPQDLDFADAGVIARLVTGVA